MDELADPGARNFVIGLRAGRFHGFVVRRGRTIVGYVDRCPHLGVPLAQSLDKYLTRAGDFIKCDWHGAIFTIADGTCLAGPCVGEALLTWPVEIVGESVVTAEVSSPRLL